ncbi:MAG: hypothetical protein ACFCU3_01280 [Verrucomicrobiales bacterium]
MQISDEQKKAVSGWIQAGATLAEVQKRLREEFELGLTYMDVRFLVDDLKLKLIDQPKNEVTSTDPLPTSDAEPSAPGKVSVSLDTIAKPGRALSGQVTFSDGKKGEWYFDETGRLGLQAEEVGYRPSQEDLMAFETELRGLLESQRM